MTTRRQFLQASAATAGSLVIPLKSSQANSQACPPEPGPELLDPNTITKFEDPLPIPAVLKPTGNSRNAASYKVTMTEFEQQVLPANLPATTVWGYEGSFPGPTIEARRNKPVKVKWINELPMHHLFPIDTTLHGSEAWQPEVRTVVHLHGAHTKPQFDGFPEDWYTSNQRKNFAVFRMSMRALPASTLSATMLKMHSIFPAVTTKYL
jgi:spore coat protein A